MRGPNKVFNIYSSLEVSRRALRPRGLRAFAVGLALLAGVLISGAAGAQSGCPGSTTAVGSPNFPQYSNSIANSGVYTGDKYIYFLSYYGFVRVDISNPGQPTNPQLAQVGFDRGVTGGGGGGGHVVVDCDCHGGGQTMAVAEAPAGSPAAGDSRLISNWEPYYLNATASTPFQAARAVGSAFDFAQQVNANPTATDGGEALASIYLPGANKFFAYVPTAGAGGVQTFDMTVTTGLTGQTCDSSRSNCVTNPLLGIQPIPSSNLAWVTSAGGGVWAGQGVVAGQTRYILVGAGGGTLKVAFIDPATGIPVNQPALTLPYTNGPEDLAIATVKGSTYIFSAEGSPTSGTGGLQIYEIQANAIVRMPRPAAFNFNYTRVVVKSPSASSPTPLIFIHRSAGGSFIDIYDTNWLVPGQIPNQQPRLGGTVPHLGSFPIGGGANVAATSFGAKVVQNGSVVTAYIFEVVATAPEYSVASTKKDVSCIAADPTAPAVASLLMTNVSAASRLAPENGKNYYGDRWRMQDTSSTGVPLTFLQWDLNAPDTSTVVPPVPPSFVPDIPNWAMAAPGAPGSVPQNLENLDGGSGTGTGPGIYWPCDPSAGSAGDPITSAGCYASVGSPNGQQTFNIKILTENQNPAGAPTPSIAAASQLVQAPIVYVNGQTGNPVAQPVSVLTGQGVLNVLGAPATQGNTAEATFQWTLTLVSGGTLTPTGQTVNPVPGNVTGFSLTATYRGGYVAPTVSGTINQTDLVAAFALQSSTVVTPGSLTVINLMQKAASATLDGVDYVIQPGAISGTLAGTFNVVNGTASIAAPAIGSYTITLTYRYHGQQPNQTQTPPAQPFTTTNWAPAPIIGIFYDAGATQLVNCSFGCNLVQGTTYYLADTELVPGGAAYPGANFYYFSGSNTFVSSAAGVAPSTGAFTPQAVCATGCYVHALVGGTSVPPATDSQHLGVTVVSSAQPLTASVNGPTNGSPGVAVSFSANATGGAPPYSYQWACQYAGQFSTFVAGGPTTSCSYPSSNTYQVVVKVTDSQSNVTTSAPFSILIGGGGGGGNLAVTVSGPDTATPGTAVTFTATATGGSGYTFTWTPGESPFDIPENTGSTPTYTHHFAAATTITYTVSCTVTSGASTAQGTKAIQILVNATPGPLGTYSVQGATQTSPGSYNADSGKSLTFTAVEVPANVAASNGYSWDFGDGSPQQHTQQATHSFQGTGSKTVTLVVQGDGVNRIGTATSSIQFNVTPPAFQAMLVPSAEHSAVLADPTGILKFWATDVSVANPGTGPITVSPAFLSFSATQGLTFDLSTIIFDSTLKVTIPPGGQNSWVDIVKILAGDVANKGTLILKYEGGDATPLVTARVYFAPAADPLGPASGSALPSFRATSDGEVVPQNTQVTLEQDLPGLRGDALYYFRLTLFNSAATGGTFRISAVDDRGVPVTLLDPRTGVLSTGGGVDFAIGPYQAIDWDNLALGMGDPARRYVLKAHPTTATGHLVASAAVRDRLTRDQVLVTSDAPPAFQENCVGSPGPCVNYIVPGASRFQSATGARWRTGLSIFNSSLSKRGVALEYHYQDTALATPEQVAKYFVFLDPGQLAFWDDVVAQTFATVGNNLADPNNGTAGVLKIIHFVDPETSTAPLIISARNYDDQPTGTVGSQLSVYTGPVSLGPNEPSLILAGLEADGGSNPKPRFETIVSVFSFDDQQTTVRLTALRNDGTVLGFHDLVLNQPGGGGHFQPRNLNIPDFAAQINQPVTVKVDVLSGGRVGAYALLRDLVTRDPTYVQAIPQSQN